MKTGTTRNLTSSMPHRATRFPKSVDPGLVRPVAREPPASGGPPTKNYCLDLDSANVLRLVTFPTLANLEFDPLAFFERLEPVAIDVGKMHEDIFAVFS